MGWFICESNGRQKTGPLKHDYRDDMGIGENLGLTFSTTEDILGDKVNKNLVPNGSNLGVTHASRHKYIFLLADYKLNRLLEAQSQAFLRGLKRVIPLHWFEMVSFELTFVQWSPKKL